MIKDGILNIYKPQDMTSHDVVAIARRALHIKKIGHTGTLDPMATGVLPICIGKSTRIIEYLDMDMKTYRCTMVLGIQTDTQDVWGTVLSENSTDGITEEDVRKAFEGFRGVTDQKPPMYSALKVNGKKLYEYAREGKEVEVKTRKIYISDLTIENIDLSGSEKSVTFTVTCTKGTYIRTICQDAGNILGCGAALSALERIQSGFFRAEDAVTIDELRTLPEEELEKKLVSAQDPLCHFGKITLGDVQSVKFINGIKLDFDRCHVEEKPEFEEQDFYLPIRDEFRRAYNVYGTVFGDSAFLGVAFHNRETGLLECDKVFYTR